MSNTATIKVALRIDDQGMVRGFRDIGTESEKAGKRGRQSFNEMDQGAAGFNSRLVSIKSGIAGLMVVLTAMKTVEVFNRINAEGMEFENTMKRVGAVSRANLETYEKLEASARQAGATTEWQAKQAAQALQFEAMAGMEAQNAIQGLPDLLDLATGSQVELGIASDIATDNLTAFKMQISELPRLNDAFINTTTRSNTTVQMLGESFKYTAPVAAQMGYNVEQTAALLGVMANSGIKASDAGTDLRQILLRTADAAERLGLDAGASLIDVLEVMHDRQMSANEVTDLFGILASKSAMVLMNNVDAYKKLNRELVENQGATRELAEQIRDSADNDWKIMISAISEAGLKMYDLYEGDYRSLIREITDEVNDNAAAFETLGHAIAGVLKLMENVVSVGGWATEKIGHIGELVTLNAQAQGMASGGVFSRNLIDGTSFEELKALVKLGEKVMSNDFLESQTAQAELLKMQIDQLEEKLSGSIFYPQGAREQLAAMKADYEKITKAVQEAQSYQKDATSLERLAAMYANAREESQENSKALSEEAAKTIKDFETAYTKATKSSFEYERLILKEKYDNYAKHVTDKAALDRWYSAELERINKAQAEQELQSRQENNQEKYAIDIALAEQVQEDTWLIRDKGLADALEQHEATQTRITEMEYEEEQKRSEQSKKELEKRLKEEERLHEKLIETQQRAYESLFEKIQGYVADLTADYKNAWDTIKDIGKRTAAELVSTFATQTLVMPVVLSVGSMMGLSWQGSSFEDIANVAGYGSGSGFGIMDLFSAGKSIFTMPSTTSAYSSLTSGTMGDIGEALFGAFWAGGAVPISTGALAAGAELGWGATAMAEIGTGTGMGGIASSLAAAAPYLSMAALAIPLIMSFFGEDPDPRVAVFSGRLENSGEYEGEINSPSGYNYHTWLQDVDNRAELGEAITTYFDAKLDAIDAAFDFDLKEITEGYDFGDVIGDPVNQYDGDLEALLNVMSENMLGGLMPVLMQQLLPNETWETIGDTFNRDFLLDIQQDGEDLYETFIRFGSVVQGTEDFMARYTEQVEVYGETAKTAIENLSAIMATMEEIDAGLETITDVSSITTLKTLTDAWYDLIEALEDAHAKTEEVAAAQSAMAQAIGASITGLTADALQSALSQGGDVGAIIEASITGSAYAYIAQTISDSYLAAINEKIGQIWIDTDGDIQAVIDAMSEIDTTEAQAQLQDLAGAFDLVLGAGTIDDQLTAAAATLETALDNEISSKQSELTILQDNLDTARDNYLNALDAEIGKQEEARDAAEDAAETFRDLADALSAGKLDILSEYGGDPAESFALAKELYAAALEGAWNKDPDAMATLPDLAKSYLETGKSVLNAVELNDLVATVYSQMSATESIAKVEAQAQEEAVDAAQEQIDALQETRDEVSGAADTLLSMDAAADDYYAASLALDESGLEQEISTLEAQLAELRSLNVNIISLAQARTDYNVAKVAVDEASGNYTFNEDIYLQNKLNQLNSNADSADVQAANEKYGNTDGVWTRSELEAAIASGGMTAEDHYRRYGAAEGVSPYVVQSVGYADGGIASGPASGYFELLHGTEAIIPLGKGALSLIIQGASDDYGQQLVNEVVEFRETMEQHLFSMRSDLKTIATMMIKWDRFGIPKERAA